LTKKFGGVIAMGDKRRQSRFMMGRDGAFVAIRRVVPTRGFGACIYLPNEALEEKGPIVGDYVLLTWSNRDELKILPLKKSNFHQLWAEVREKSRRKEFKTIPGVEGPEDGR